MGGKKIKGKKNMLRFCHLGFDLSTSIDWLGLGFWYAPGASASGHRLLEVIKVAFSDNPVDSKHSFYTSSYTGDGWTFSFDPKKGCNNPPFSLEIRGSFFTTNPGHVQAVDDVLRAFYSANLLCNPFRIDVCLDIFTPFDYSKIKFESSFMKGYYQLNSREERCGFYLGKGDTRYRLYDKKLERETSGVRVSRPFWWRWEVQLRGDKLKAQFPRLPLELYYLDLYQVGCLCLADRKCVDVSPSFIQASSAYVISGEPLRQKKKKGSWLASMEWFDKEMKRRIQSFKRSLRRKYPELMYVEGELELDQDWYLKNSVWEEDEEKN